MKLPSVSKNDILFLEKEMDAMNKQLPELRSFILPGGHSTVSYCHISRCICRRAERKTTYLQNESKVDDLIIMYLNRLSDYLFVLARKLSFDLNAEEIAWKPRN